MAFIVELPKEIILEIAKFLDLKHSLALLQTCQALYSIANTQSFWRDQVYHRINKFNLLLSQAFIPTSINDLRSMAIAPYVFEQSAMQGKLQDLSPIHLKPDIVALFLGASIVPGGHWLVTISSECNDHPRCTFVRIWRIAPESEGQEPFTCIASMPLRVGFIPLELCVRPGEAALDLLVFVSSHKQGNWEPGGYITALQINLGAVDPEFVLLGTLDVQKFCSGLRLQGDAVVATLFWPGDEQCEFLIWDWKTGARVTLPSPGPGEDYWFTAASERASAIWNFADRCIEVHWSDRRDGHDRGERHIPVLLSCCQCQGRGGTDTNIPIVREFRDRSGDHIHYALAHFPHETIRITIEECGEGRILFTKYPKHQDSDDHSNHFVTDYDIASEIVMTIGGHLIALSGSGLITTYRVEDCADQNNLGESVSCQPLNFADNLIRSRYHFICPFSGVVGTVSSGGDFYIWRQK